MLTLGWFALADDVLIDKFTNSISLIKCVESVMCPAFPATLQTIQCCCYYYKTPLDSPEEALDVKFILLDPSGNKQELPGTTVKGKDNRIRIIGSISGIVFNSPGVHFVILQEHRANEWKEAGRLPLDVQSSSASGISPNSNQ